MGLCLETFEESVSKFKALTEAHHLHMHRRDLFSRTDRALREKLFKPSRDILRARRERHQRHRRHRLKNVNLGPPSLRLSTRFRFR